MFERYNEAARRTLFFARYEATQQGSLSMETEHLLLGLVREPGGVAGRVLGVAGVTPERIREDIENRSAFRERVATSVELPFSAEIKRVLQVAASEADQLHHAHIGTEHLLLAMLREDASVAGGLLAGYGLGLEPARKLVSELVGDMSRLAPVRPEVDSHVLIDDLVQLAAGLAAATPGSEDAATLLSRAMATLKQLRGCLPK